MLPTEAGKACNLSSSQILSSSVALMDMLPCLCNVSIVLPFRLRHYRKKRFLPLNPIPGGGGPKRPPPSGFSRAIRKRLEISSSYLVTFRIHPLPTFWYKKIGRVRSGQVTRAGRLTLPHTNFAVTPRPECLPERFETWRIE